MQALKAFGAFLASGTGRRLLVFLAGFLVPLLNKKFGWDLEPNTLVGEVALAGSYILGSNAKDAVVAHADAKVEAVTAALAARA